MAASQLTIGWKLSTCDAIVKASTHEDYTVDLVWIGGSTVGAPFGFGDLTTRPGTGRSWQSPPTNASATQASGLPLDGEVLEMMQRSPSLYCGLMPSAWPALRYEEWRTTRDTVHAHTQTLGKLAAVLAPAEPQLQHAALRLTARGWETAPLPAPDGSGALVVALDLHTHEALAEHSDGRARRVALGPDRPVGAVTRELLDAIHGLVGAVDFDPTPQEVSWTVPLDEDDEHTRYDAGHVAAYLAAATRAALVLAAFRAPYRGRSTPVNAWWGSFDLAVSLYSGLAAEPPSGDFIMRNSMDAQEVAVGWWPGDARYGRAAFYAYAHPAPPGFGSATLATAAAHWEPALGEFVLDWDDVISSTDPHALAVEFARSAFRHSCAVGGWDPALPASVEGTPPPVR